MVECQLPKLNVAGSSPVTRFPFRHKRPEGLQGHTPCERLMGRSAPRFDQLQNLGATACEAALTIQRFEDQPSGFGDVPGCGCGARPRIQLGLFLLKPLSIVARGRIAG